MPYSCHAIRSERCTMHERPSRSCQKTETTFENDDNDGCTCHARGGSRSSDLESTIQGLRQRQDHDGRPKGFGACQVAGHTLTTDADARIRGTRREMRVHRLHGQRDTKILRHALTGTSQTLNVYLHLGLCDSIGFSQGTSLEMRREVPNGSQNPGPTDVSAGVMTPHKKNLLSLYALPSRQRGPWCSELKQCTESSGKWTSTGVGCDNGNDNDTLREVPHPSNEGLALQARV